MEHYGAAGVQLGVYFCVSGTAGMGIANDLSLDIWVLGFPCAAEPACQAAVNSSSRLYPLLTVAAAAASLPTIGCSSCAIGLTAPPPLGGLNQQWLASVHNCL